MKASRTPMDENVSPQVGIGSTGSNGVSPVGQNVANVGGSAKGPESSAVGDNGPAKSDDQGIGGWGSAPNHINNGPKANQVNSSKGPDLSGI